MGFKPTNGYSLTNTEGRIICIGDLHGCYDETMDLLDLMKVTKKDTVVFLGDLVDRGPENGKCVDLAMRHTCLLGNHEDKHLRYLLQEEQSGPLDESKLPPTHAHTRSQLTKKHFDYLKNLPTFIRFPQYNHAAVHGGVWPNLPLEDQNLELLIRMQYINPEKSKKNYWAQKRPTINELIDESYKFWTHFYTGTEKIIFGHSVLNQPLVTHNAIGLDGGCAFGRELWAYSLPDQQIYRVPSRNPKDESNKTIYWITDTVGTY